MRPVLLSAGALTTLCGAAVAQRPALSGTWTAAPQQTPTTLPAAPSPVMGALFSLALDSDRLVLTRPMGEFSIVTPLPLDGTRATTVVPGRLCEGERIFHESATWEGEALVFTNAAITPAGGGPVTETNARRIFRLEAPDRLVVEATMVQQGQRRQVGSVYVRSTNPLPGTRPASPLKGLEATIARIAWIGTSWTGTTGSLTTEERWTPPASGGMIGVSRTLRGAALAGFEFLCIAEREGSLAYLAMPNARTPATVFMLTALSDTSATFENPSHDFPKLIRYTRTADGGLETMIAGANGARAQTFRLAKAAPAP
jgi:hypothetical protein